MDPTDIAKSLNVDQFTNATLEEADGSAISSYDAACGLIDRSGTPEGRAYALAILDRLGEDWAPEDQRTALEVVRPALESGRAEMRQWGLDSIKR